MTFQRLSKDKIKIQLSQMDMDTFSIQYEQLDCQDPHTRETILTLLELAEQETGFYPNDGHLFVEAYPAASGCTLYFTAIAGEQAPEQDAVCTPLVFSFTDLDTIISGASALFRTYGHRIFQSILYYGEGIYYLVIRPLDQSQLQSVMLLSEYGTLIGKGRLAVAHLQEHCKCLMQEEAIEHITYYLSGKIPN